MVRRKIFNRGVGVLAILTLILGGLLGCTKAKPLPKEEGRLTGKSPTALISPAMPLTTPTPAKTPGSVLTPAQTPQPTPLPSPTPMPVVTYVVRAGDTAFSIARRYGIEVADLAAANPSLADPSRLAVGQELKIPAPAPAPSTPSSTTPKTGTPGTKRTYTVQPGDSLFSIATRFGSTVEAIASANQLADPTLIKVGQVLTIP